MFCKKCGNKLDESDNFCSNCGEKVSQVSEDCFINEEEVVNAFKVPKRAGFKDGVKALFAKLFVFKGKSSRSEFNFGLLFLVIVTSIVSMIVIYPPMLEWMETLITETNLDNYEVLINGLDSILLSKSLLSPYNFTTLGICLIFIIFLSAPIYRRMMDIYGKKKIATIAVIVFVVGQVLSSPLLYCLLSDEVYNLISTPISIISICASIVTVLCIFKNSLSK